MKASSAHLLVVFGALAFGLHCVFAEEAPVERLDSTAWGSDHVGQDLPQFVTGDECLFCHRDVGPTWVKNRHRLTIRPVVRDSEALKVVAAVPGFAEFASDVDLVLGSEHRIRFLRRANAYGKLELLSAAVVPGDSGSGHVVEASGPHWDAHTFADRCAGCHATAIDSKSKAFAAASLDCATCHGDVPLAHSNDPSLVHLSAEKRAAREVVSICGQCHLRGGTSRSTGRPYPNQFVAGDNLFRDFQIDWDAVRIERMGPSDRHVFENVREVALFGKEGMTCLSCHDVHGQSTERHQAFARTAICRTCHVGNDPVHLKQSAEAHSAVCDY